MTVRFGAEAGVKLVLLRGQSQYEVLPYFLSDIAAAFTRRGWVVEEIDTAALAGEAFLVRVAEARPDLVFSFNIGAEVIDAHGRAIAERTGAPHIVQIVDHPLQDFERLNAMARSVGLLLVDPSHVRALKTFYAADRFAYLGFSPHGGMGPVAPVLGDAASFTASRDIPVFFAGTYYRPGRRPWEDGATPPILQQFFRDALQRALAVEWVAAEDVFDKVLAEAGLDLNDRSEDTLSLRRLSGFVHQEVRLERRLRFFQAAARVGLPLTVVGAHYEADQALYPNMTVLGPKPVAEVLGLMARARLVANTSANFGLGSHERPLTAMRAGAVAVSDYTGFFADRFSAAEMALFRWTHLEEDLAKLAGLLGDPDALYAMAKAGQAKAAAEHGWAERVDSIIAAGRAVATKLRLPSALAEA